MFPVILYSKKPFSAPFYYYRGALFLLYLWLYILSTCYFSLFYSFSIVHLTQAFLVIIWSSVYFTFCGFLFCPLYRCSLPSNTILTLQHIVEVLSQIIAT